MYVIGDFMILSLIFRFLSSIEIISSAIHLTTIGNILYNEGFILLTSSAAISANTDIYGSAEDAVHVAPSWYYFGTTGSSAAATSSSFSIEMQGINYVETMTMLAHAKERELNYSNNPTFLSSSFLYLIFPLLAWKSSKLLHEETSSHFFSPGDHISIS